MVGGEIEDDSKGHVFRHFTIKESGTFISCDVCDIFRMSDVVMAVRSPRHGSATTVGETRALSDKRQE